MARIRRRQGAVELTLSADDAFVLRMLAEMVTQLLAPDEATPAQHDPLEALVATSTEPVAAPDDPALLRLLPDAYGDPADAGEFRRLMESDLRQQKIAALDELMRAVADPDGEGVVVRLTGDEAEVWLQALNDIRLFLGIRLEVTEELSEQIEALDADDPRLPQLLTYDWVGYLQESLLRAID
jgi:sarcosine oxidase gamma subunit